MEKNDLSALFKVSYGLYVLSAKSGEKDNANINNAFLQITSHAPVGCLLSVNKQHYTTELISQTRKFNLSVLSADAPFEIFKRFGYQSGREVDKFQGFTDFGRSENGLIYLTKHANAFLSFDVLDSIDFDTHILFKATLTENKVLNDKESITYNYYMQNVKPKPEADKKVGYRCMVCDYIYEGNPLPEDFICPLCGHGADDFEKI
jgi:flavin reductase (DIM6/NTAB) family NADH-FMN oxidoreductase RutF